MMNRNYMDELIKRNKCGKIIQLVNNNLFNYSQDDYEYVYNKCLYSSNEIINVSIYMLDMKIILKIFDIKHIEFYFSRSYDFLKYFFKIDRYNAKNLIEHIPQIHKNDIVLNKFLLNEKLIYNKNNEIYGNTIKSIKYILTPKITQLYTHKNYSAIFVYLTEYSFTENIKNNYEKITSYLLSPIVREIYGINPFSNWNRSLKVACKRCNMNKIKYLLSEDMQKNFPLDFSEESNKRIFANIYTSKYFYEKNPIFICDNTDIGEMHNKYNTVIKYLMSEEIQKRCPSINPSAMENNMIKTFVKYKDIEMLEYVLTDDIQARYPQLHVSNLDSELVKNIENLISYSIR